MTLTLTQTASHTSPYWYFLCFLLCQRKRSYFLPFQWPSMLSILSILPTLGYWSFISWFSSPLHNVYSLSSINHIKQFFSLCFILPTPLDQHIYSLTSTNSYNHLLISLPVLFDNFWVSVLKRQSPFYHQTI